MQSRPTLVEPSYRRHVHQRIEALMPILAQAAVGNYNHNVPLQGPQDEFSELYVGVQLMLETIREKLTQLEQLNTELEDIFVARSNQLFGSETKFSAVADAAADAFITVDGRGRISYFNRAAEIIFGYSAATIKGRPLTILVPSLSPTYLKALTPPTSGSKKLSRPIRGIAKHKRGRNFPVELSFATWQLEHKTYTTAIIRDLSVHQMLVDKLAQRTSQLEDKVAQQTALLRQQLAATEQNRAQDEALLSSMGDGIVAMDKAGRIFFANQGLARLAGLNLNHIRGRLYYSAIVITDETGRPISRAQRPLHQALQTGKRISSSQYYCRTVGGQLIPVAITAAPVVQKGKIVGGIDIIRDITKEKESERLKSEFVSLASHQLRTPATAVKGLLSLVLDGYSGQDVPDQPTLLRQAFAENEHQLKLIDDMLDVAKLEAGELTLEPAEVELRSLLKSVIAEQHELIRVRRQIIVTTAPQPVKVQADPTKLQMVFENIITNASKYSAPGRRISIHLSTTKGWANVRIKDHGIGIAAHDVPNLFKRFSRAANAAKTHTSGSGLGLYLAKKIIDLHLGKITVVSRLNQGSTFTVSLPIQTKE